MKGDQASYTINLEKAFLFPPRIRIRKAITKIGKFVKKHTRSKNFALSTEVNEFLHLHSKNIPRRVPAILLKEADRVMVFLQNGKQLQEYLKKKEDDKKKKEPKKEEKKEEGGEEKKKKLEAKKAKEDAAKAADIKRKTG